MTVRWRDRLAMYGVPTFAGLVTAAILLGPGGERTVVGARAWGYPVAGSRVCALRLHTVAHYSGVYVSVAHGGLELVLSRGDEVVGSWSGASPQHGFVEAGVTLSEPLAEGTRLVLSAGGRVLLQAPIALGDAPASLGGADPRASVDGRGVRVSVPRGFLAPPFAERASVTAFVGGPDDPPPKLAFEAVGAASKVVAGPTKGACPLLCRYDWQVELVAQAPTVQLSAKVTHPSGQPLSWSGDALVKNGSVWLDPASTQIAKLRAPTAIDHAYLSLLTNDGRVWGAVTDMQADDDGFAHAEVALPKNIDMPATLMVASEPGERGTATAGWPLSPALGAVEPRPIQQLGDAMPALIQADDDRRTRARRPAYGLIIAAGLFELLYLWRRSRRERERLERHLRGAAEGLDESSVTAMSSSTPLLWLTVFFGALMLAFAVLAGVAAWG